MHSINKIYFLNLYDYYSELIWKPHASLFMHKHPIVVYIKIFSKPSLLRRALNSFQKWMGTRNNI